uniref:Uncharacterized protein n=1 Tax=Fagus sylvatica TaxID=28930 RepID=A0A2N9EW85_FAGSY
MSGESFKPENSSSIACTQGERELAIVKEEGLVSSVVGISADADGDNVTGGVGMGSVCVISGIGSCVSAMRLGARVGQAGDVRDSSVGPGPKIEGSEKGITRASKGFEGSIGGSSAKKNFPRGKVICSSCVKNPVVGREVVCKGCHGCKL